MIESEDWREAMSETMERACKRQQCYEAGMKVSAEVVKNFGGIIPSNNPYANAVQFTAI